MDRRIYRRTHLLSLLLEQDTDQYFRFKEKIALREGLNENPKYSIDVSFNVLGAVTYSMWKMFCDEYPDHFQFVLVHAWPPEHTKPHTHTLTSSALLLATPLAYFKWFHMLASCSHEDGSFNISCFLSGLNLYFLESITYCEFLFCYCCFFFHFYVCISWHWSKCVYLSLYHL